MNQVRVAIVGFGLAGRYFHAPLIDSTPGLALTHVVTSSPERAAAATASYPDVSVVASVEELWGHVDLLVVATPNAAHVSVAEAGLEHGLAVVVDKPLAVDARSAARLWARATEAALPLSVFHNRRWDSELLTVRRLLERGDLGHVFRFESRLERWRPDAPATLWRAEPAAAGGGLVLDLGTHLVDQALVLFGPVDSVYAEVATRRPGHVGDDDAFIALTHTGGVISHLRVSAVTAAPGPRMRVLGSEAGFVIDAPDSQETALRAGRRPDDGRPWGVEPDSAWGRLWHGDPGAGVLVPSESGDWPAYYRLMRVCIADGGPVPVEPGDAVAVLELLDAARLSAGERRTVALPHPAGAQTSIVSG